MYFGKVWLFHSVLLILLLSIQSNEQFRLAFLESINSYRDLHGSPRLILDKEFCKLAQREAIRLCQPREPRSIPFDEPQSFSNLTCHALKPLKCIHDWYNEGDNYDYDKYSPSRFTLMIWKSSKYIGIGFCSDLEDVYYVVVKIYPRGNEIGQFRENIGQPISQCSILTPNCILAAISLLILLAVRVSIFNQ